MKDLLGIIESGLTLGLFLAAVVLPVGLVVVLLNRIGGPKDGD